MPWTPTLPAPPTPPAVPGWFAYLTLQLVGIASAEAFGTGAAAVGPLTLQLAGIGSVETFGALNVQGPPRTVTLSGIPSAQAFGGPQVTPGPATITGTGIASAQAFGTATLTTGPVTVSLTGIASGEAFGTAKVAQLVTLGAGIASAEAFGTAKVSYAVAGAGIASAEAFGTATLTRGPVTVTLTGIASAEAFGSAGVSKTVALTGIASAQAFGTATIATSAPPVALDNYDVGSKVFLATNITWSHVVNANNADVFVFVCNSNSSAISSVTCGGTAMTLVSSLAHNGSASNGSSRLYRLTGVSAGSKTISVTFGANTTMSGSSVSYLYINSIGTAQTDTNTIGAGISHNVTCTAGRRIVQMFGVRSTATITLTSPTGGTNLVNNSDGSVGAADTISEATATTTFGVSTNVTGQWSSIGLELIPA